MTWHVTCDMRRQLEYPEKISANIIIVFPLWVWVTSATSSCSHSGESEKIRNKELKPNRITNLAVRQLDRSDCNLEISLVRLYSSTEGFS